MNWRPTILFAVVLAVLLAVYFLAGGDTAGPLVTEKPPVLPKSISAAAVRRIEVRPKDGEAFTLERRGGSRESRWHLTRPIDRPADPQVIQQMLFTLTRFVRGEEVKVAGDAEAGLDDPRLEVTFHAGAENATVRFGIPSPLNTTQVYYRVGEDPSVHLVDVGVVDAFSKPVSKIRTSLVLQLEPYRVVKIGLKSRFLVARGTERRVEYETSLLEKVEKEGVPGWYLVEPWREFVDPLKPGQLLSGLSQLAAREFQEIGEAQARALEEAEEIVTIHVFGREEPLRVRVAGKGPSKAERWVQVEGIDEAAVVEEELVRHLPLRRNDFRLDTLFQFSAARVKVLTVDARKGGKVVIERQEKQRGPDAPVTESWVVREPAGIRVEDERVGLFARAVLGQKIEEFLGVQDYTLMNLDPADVTVTVELKDGEPRRYYFGRTSTGGFLRREGKDEAFQVASALVDNLLRLELNFLHPEVFSVPRSALRMFEFEWKKPGLLQPVFYRVRQDPRDKFWKFVDEKNRARKADPDLVSEILTVLNYIKARSYLSRDPERIRESGLDAVGYGARLRIWYDGGGDKPAEFYISRNLSKIVGTRKYHMLRAGDTAVFEANPLVVETLQRIPLLEE